MKPTASILFLIALILIMFLEGCFLLPNDCKDEIYREFTEAEQNFFPYEVGDTVYFINKNHGEEYFLYCTYKRNSLRDTSYYHDKYCDNGGYWQIYSQNTISLFSNYQNDTDEPFRLELYHSARVEQFSAISITSSFGLHSDFRFSMDPETGKFGTKNNYANDSIIFYDELNLENRLYRDVYKIFSKVQGLLPSHQTYVPPIDSLYFNKTEGILKLVSNEINLEWVLK